MQKQLLVGGVLALVLVGSGSFYGGMKYQQTKVPTFGARMPGGFGQMRDGAVGQAMRRPVGGDNLGAVGEVLAKDATGFTIKLRDGGSKNIFTTSSTRVSKMADGSMNDLETGTNVTVLGTTSADGSLTATQVQVRPAMPPQEIPKP